MQGLLHTAISTHGGHGRNRPVGLLHDRTGVPAFLLGFAGIQHPRRWELHSLEQAVEAMRAMELPRDRQAWNPVLSFFESQGSEALVVGTPVSVAGAAWKDLLGADRGPGRRTGVALLGEVVPYSDVFLIPQASSWAPSLGALRSFWEETSRTLQGLRGPILLLDAPCRATLSEVAELTSGLDMADAALFYPWVQVKESILPASPVVAAAIQRTDAEVGIHELASNRAAISGMDPVRKLSAAELRLCQERRIGSFFIDDSGGVRLWGGQTLSLSAAPADRVLSVRRTMQAMRVALEQICEPFVMEPVGAELPVHLETRLTNFLHSVRGKLDREQQPPYFVEVKLTENQGEPAMDVRVELALARTLERLSIEMNLCA